MIFGKPRKKNILWNILAKFMLNYEKNMMKFIWFEDGRPFEPDYILSLRYKNNPKSLYYQVFIESKGNYLKEKDAWKENFLLSLRKECQAGQLWEDKKYIVWSVPFYNSLEERIFNEKFQNAFF